MLTPVFISEYRYEAVIFRDLQIQIFTELEKVSFIEMFIENISNSAVDLRRSSVMMEPHWSYNDNTVEGDNALFY